MPSSKFDSMNRIKSVEREHTAIRYAADFLLNAARGDSTILDRVVRVRDVEESVERLEGTYVIRLFAEFETILRDFWTVSRRTNPPSRTRDLLNGIGANRKVSDDTIQNAHVVRGFRNTLIHERDHRDAVAPVSIADARRYLCTFLNFLPPEW